MLEVHTLIERSIVMDFKAFYTLVVLGTAHAVPGTGNDVSGTVLPYVGDRNQESNTFATIY